MGGQQYNSVSRSIRSAVYQSQPVNQTFKQNDEGEIHASMRPAIAKVREARDSDTHPNSVPIIIGLDVTGSMDLIPIHLIKEGLPTLVSTIISSGIPDPQILFLPIGDHYRDHAPLQVGQFESGDEEMDMWLERTWLEKGGGGNRHESYHLAWYFAAMHTFTDSWEKRGQKGFLFTIGDELVHEKLEGAAIDAIMNTENSKDYSAEALFGLASHKYHVYHLHVVEGSYGHRPEERWKELLGDNLISVLDYREIPQIISQIVVSQTPKIVKTISKEDIHPESVAEVLNTPEKTNKITL